MSVSMAFEAVAVTVNWAGTAGSLPTTCAAWSRCTRLSRPSTTGTPASVTAEPIAAKTAGQQRPTSASGTVVRLGASGSPKVAVTPVWSATRSGSQSTVTVAVPSMHRGQRFGPVDTGGDGQHRAHGGGGVLGGDHRGTAVNGVGGQA